MATVSINGSSMGTILQQMLMCDDIVPGASPSYEICKIIAAYHPLGQKMVETPVKLAQSQARKIAVPGSPEERVKTAFLEEWVKIGANKHIRNTRKVARTYGIASIALLEEGVDSAKPLDLDKIWDRKIAFNVFDPLNTAGSLVLNQNPNAMDFQKYGDIVVSGQRYHRSRTVVNLNEEPVYILYTSSAFGFVGRSVFQRALFPLKTFLQTMRTDDAIVRKSAVIVAKMEQPGSVINGLMQKVYSFKRALLKEAETTDVLGIAIGEDIETLNMQNLEGPYTLARTNCIKNVATGADMPAKLLDNETLVSGFGEGTEDAKNIARYIDGEREEMQPLYAWFDRIVQYRAWNPSFYKTIQRDFPGQYGKVDYQTAFYEWTNNFVAEWPNLLEEPDSEKAKVDDVKLKALLAAVEILAPMLDPENKVVLIEWVSSNFNELKMLFPDPLNIDLDALRNYVPPAPAMAELEEPHEPRPFAAQDSAPYTIDDRLERMRERRIPQIAAE